MNVRRRLLQLVLALYACALLGSVAMVIGPAINDVLIARDPGRGLATVTGVNWLRTSAEYQDEEGRYHSPRYGLLYPTGLGEGQRVWVTYSTSRPDLVKVEGRAWTLSIVPALSVAAVSTLIAGAAWWAVGARRRPSPAA
ncbi:DUF3592 domain-containing protein [Corynebacterium timonense]|uniref:DUF3592 domain-containing protein n=1 Tax=Corynebacterium timonense TaxID=441500 RepID=A0A1H1T011_9CORY|nr:DUF3592 domain-containing protein [Corynebacterium timonense]SDS53316.1 hypothetical protein SAMN04488539_1861 [Corynebacterium timonense]